jgi:hypothetical protein
MALQHLLPIFEKTKVTALACVGKRIDNLWLHNRPLIVAIVIELV